MLAEKLGIENGAQVPIVLHDAFSDEDQGQQPASDREEYLRAVLAVAVRRGNRDVLAAGMVVLLGATEGADPMSLMPECPRVSRHLVNVIMAEVTSLLAAGEKAETAPTVPASEKSSVAPVENANVF